MFRRGKLVAISGERAIFRRKLVTPHFEFDDDDAPRRNSSLFRSNKVSCLNLDQIFDRAMNYDDCWELCGCSVVFGSDSELICKSS